MNNFKLKRYQADLILMLVAIIWGSIFAVTKNTLNFVSPLIIVAVRFVLAFVILVLLFWKKFNLINRSDILGGVIVGTTLFGALVTQVIGLTYTTASKQSFLIAISVVMVPFLDWIVYKKRPNLRVFVGAFTCLIGMGFLTFNEGFIIELGDTITLISALLYAANLVEIGYFVQKQDTAILMILQFGVVSILSIISVVIFEPIPKTIAPSAWFSLVYLSIICTLIAYFLQAIGQKFTPSTHASIILSTESVWGSILAVILLNEKFTLKMILCCIAILAAILIIEYRNEEQSDLNTSV